MCSNVSARTAICGCLHCCTCLQIRSVAAAAKFLFHGESQVSSVMKEVLQAGWLAGWLLDSWQVG